MRPSWKLFLGAYLLLSAAACVALAILAETAWSECLPLILVAAGNCVLQLLFVAAQGSLRYVGPMVSWRRLLCSGFVAVLLAAEGMGLAIVWYELMHSRSLLSLDLDESTFAKLPALMATATLWLLWRWCRKQDRLIVMRRLVCVPAIAAIVELPLAAWAHRIIVARPGHGGFLDFTGVGTQLVMILDVLILAWSLGPLFVWLYYRRERRQMRGVCPACGYDLRGLLQQRCPECGRAFTLKEIHATAETLAISAIDAARSSEASRR